MRKQLLLLIGFVFLFVSVLGGVDVGAAIVSTFDSDLDGWTGTGVQVSWQSSGGNPGGFLKEGDIDSSWAYVIAPDKFDGIWSPTGTVSADITFLGTAAVIYPPAFRIAGTSTAFEYVFSNNPTATWQTYSVSLSAAGWNKVSGSSSFADVLDNVTDFRIRVDYTDFTTPTSDAAGLDNISAPIVPIPSALLLFGSGLVGIAGARRRIRG